MNRVLYIDDKPENLMLFRASFNRYYRVFTASGTTEARRVLESEPIDVVVCDYQLEGKDGITFLKELMADQHPAIRILITSYPDSEVFQSSLVHERIFYLFINPWNAGHLPLIMESALKLRSLLNDRPKDTKEVVADPAKLFPGRLVKENGSSESDTPLTISRAIVFKSSIYQKVIDQIRRVAPMDTNVLITGETGTGKELIAAAIHELSNRKAKKLYTINCGAIPPNLIESELFGHVRGAFTGAIQDRIGIFEQAHKSTLFLDEIGELPLELQPKLLRVIQQGEFHRLGDSRLIKTDVRLIAATNRDLPQQVKVGKFRADLFFRLNVFQINSPALIERREDIPLLVQHFVQQIGRRLGKQIYRIPQETLQELMYYSWPGNIRELENFVERAIVLSTNGELTLEGWMPIDVLRTERKVNELPPLTLVKETERSYILQALEASAWRIRGKGGAAERLQLKPTTLASKMKSLGIVNRRFRDPEAS